MKSTDFTQQFHSFRVTSNNLKSTAVTLMELKPIKIVKCDVALMTFVDLTG